MTPHDFRRIALGMAGAVEASHRGSPDFRIGKRIFATLAYQAKGKGTLMLTRDQQEMLMTAEPGVFTPAAGAWGLKGSTLVLLEQVDEATLQSAMGMAWENKK